MTGLEKFEEIAKIKPKCQVCQGTGTVNSDNMKNLTVYGKTLKQLSDIIDYAYQHGYKDQL